MRWRVSASTSHDPRPISQVTEKHGANSRVGRTMTPLFLLFFLLLPTHDVGARAPPPRPNIVLIMADDLGICDPGCYGNATLRTPNIDRLAREGVKLTQHLAASPLCTPSRAAFLTGRYPVRSGMAAHGRVGVFLFSASSSGLPTSEVTFVGLLQGVGYRTALIGACGARTRWGGRCCDRDVRTQGRGHGGSGAGGAHTSGERKSHWGVVRSHGTGSSRRDRKCCVREESNRPPVHCQSLPPIPPLHFRLACNPDSLPLSPPLHFRADHTCFLFLHPGRRRLRQVAPGLELRLRLRLLPSSAAPRLRLLPRDAHDQPARLPARRGLRVLRRLPRARVRAAAGHVRGGPDAGTAALPAAARGAARRLPARRRRGRRLRRFPALLPPGQLLPHDGLRGGAAADRLRGARGQYGGPRRGLHPEQRARPVPAVPVLHPRPHHAPQPPRAVRGRSRGDRLERRVLQTLDQLGLANDTLVYFTSDHGAHVKEVTQRGEVHGSSNGGKSNNWEGGIRVPGLLRWPGVLPAGVEVDEPTSNMDIFPTVAALAGAELPRNRVIDGRDLMPLLLGRTWRSEHEFLFHYCNAYLNAVRWRPRNSRSVWKAFFTTNFDPAGANGCFSTHVCFCFSAHVTAHDPPLLFDLSWDLRELCSLSPHSEPRFGAVLHAVADAVRAHQASLRAEPTPPDQLSPANLLWKPWLQLWAEPPATAPTVAA